MEIFLRLMTNTVPHNITYTATQQLQTNRPQTQRRIIHSASD